MFRLLGQKKNKTKSSLHPRTESRKRKGGHRKGTALPQEPLPPLPRWAQEPGKPGPERLCWVPGPEDAGLSPDPRVGRPVQGASAHTPGSPARLGSPARPSLSSACRSVCFSPWSFSFLCASICTEKGPEPRVAGGSTQNGAAGQLVGKESSRGNRQMGDAPALDLMGDPVQGQGWGLCSGHRPRVPPVPMGQ